jgi:tetratricopeptide (TPR) repeat protein
MRIAVALAVLVQWAGLAGPVAARPATDEKAIARQAFVEGTRRYALGEYELALDAFKQAFLHYEEPVFLFNIAQCHRALGHKTEALQFYRTFLRFSSDATPTQRDEVRALMKQLEAALAEEQKAKNEKPTGIRAPSTTPEEEPRPAPRPSVTAVAPTPPPAALAPAAPPSPPKTPLYKKWWLWTTVGVAVVAVGVGVGLGVGLSSSGSSFKPNLMDIASGSTALRF